MRRTFLFFLFLLTVGSNSATADVSRDNGILLNDDKQILTDLQNILTTQNELTLEIQQKNLSLLDAAIEYNQNEAYSTLLVSTIVGFFVLREPVKLGSIYILNIARIVKFMKLRKHLSRFKYLEGTAATTTTSFGLSVAGSLFYMSTTLFQKGVCMFNCLQNFVERAAEKQEADFVRSHTYNQIKSEIGSKKALQLVAIIKSIRQANFANEDAHTALKKFVSEVYGKNIESVEDLELNNKPVFTKVIKALDGTFRIYELIMGYLWSSGQLA